MFEWLKGRKKQAPGEALFREAVSTGLRQGAQVNAVRQAAATLGVAVPMEMVVEEFVSVVASGLVKRLVASGGSTLKDEDTAFTAAIFVFVTCNHVSHIVGADFEFSTMRAFFDLTGDPMRAAALQADTMKDYNRMTQEGSKIILASGQNVAKWIHEPSSANLDRLGEVFTVCRNSVG